MSETYLITAKTVEEAIAIANSEYADEKHEISYEIIDMPKKGFLGIGAKSAKIKVTVTESVSADLGSLVDDIRGMKSLTSRGDDEKKNNNQKKNNKNIRICSRVRFLDFSSLLVTVVLVRDLQSVSAVPLPSMHRTTHLL